MAAPDGQAGAVTLHADARIHAGLFDGDESVTLPLAAGRRTWVHLARGSLQVNGQRLQAGDALGLVGETELTLSQGQGAEVLVFDLAD